MTEEPTRVLHIINRLDRVRGSTTWLRNMLSNSSDSGFHHTIVSTSALTGDREQEFIDDGIEIIHIPMIRIFPVLYVFRLTKELRRRKFAILHSHMSMGAGLDLLAGWLAGIKYRIAYFHSGDWQIRNGIFKFAIAGVYQFLTRAFGTHFWAPSRGTLARWMGPNAEEKPRCRAVIAGIPLLFSTDIRNEDVRTMLGIKPEDFLIGHVGRFTPQKNHETIIRTLAQLVSVRSQTVLVLIGDGPLRGKISQLARQLRVDTHVRFLGVRDDTRVLMQGMDAFFFPSHYEPLGLAVLEAQDAGVPVIASEVSGLIEAVAPSWEQYLTRPTDTSQFMAILCDIAERKPRERPSEFLESFSVDAGRKRLNEAYNTLTR